jgi:3-dehydroquinate dehydratase/shikimate dehydrogenase
MTPICIPIFINASTDIEEAIETVQDLTRPIAQPVGTTPPNLMIELRADTATPKQLALALDITRLPVIVTIRPTWEGGFSQKNDAQRIDLWESAMEEGAEYVDVELQAWERSKNIREFMEDVAEKHGTKIIVSNHSFERRPPDLDKRLERLRQVKPAHIHKIAWKAESILDAIDALRFTQENQNSKIENRKSLLALAMGEEGLLSRLLAAKFNAPFTFASAERGKESAPGQPTVHELLHRYRWQKQHANSPVFGVIGWPVEHSLSPHIHNAGFDALNNDAVYVPLPIKPTYEDFANAVNALRACPTMNLRGLSVTIPHKENAIRYVKENGGQIDDLSSHIGVINTITFPTQSTQDSQPTEKSPPHTCGGSTPNTCMRGLNSDYAGALDALVSAWTGNREDVAGKRVAVLGAGGAARAIVAALAHYNAITVIYNRTFEKAQALANEFNGKPGKVVPAPWEKLCDSCCEAYINCTPLGMHPKVNASPIDNIDPKWNQDTAVFDTVYNPLLTKLLKTAQQKGAKIIPGTEMFIRQAAIQFQQFTNHPAPLELFRKTLLDALTR